MNNSLSSSPETKSIVCGTDFTDNARLAARVATAFAKKLDAPVCLVHAVETLLAASDPNIFRTFFANECAALYSETDRMRQTGVPVQERIEIGCPDEVLVSLSEQQPTRLIIVSSLGRRASERFFLGSVSERTAERARVPTLVVRDAVPFEAWTRGEKILKVFVAFDFTAASEAALRWVKELGAIGPYELVIGYVDWPPEERSRIGSKQRSQLVGNTEEVQKVLDRDLAERVREILGPGTYRIRAEANWGRPDYPLAVMAHEEAADLIVVGSHQYWGFERLWHTSVSRGLLHNAAMSVAVVPLCTDEGCGKKRIPIVRRVLVATDFSEISNHAITHAYSILPNGGTIRLLHVVRRKTGDSPQEGFANQNEMKTCEEQLRKLVPVTSVSNIVAEFEVVQHPDVAEAIAQAAERINADVICIGTHGRSGLTKTFLGSVAQSVLACSRRPIFIVRPKL